MSQRLQELRLKSRLYKRISRDFIDQTVNSDRMSLVFKELELHAAKAKAHLRRVKQSNTNKIRCINFAFMRFLSNHVYTFISLTIQSQRRSGHLLIFIKVQQIWQIFGHFLRTLSFKGKADL